MKGEILIVEDEERIARVLQLELQHEGYRVRHAYDGNAALELILSEPWDLVLLDIMLPGMDGLQVLQRARQADLQVPILLLSARDAIPDKVSGLDLGANDYITKPFAIEELLARMRNLLRFIHFQAESSDLLRIDDLTIHRKTRKVIRNNKSIDLTPREFDLLLYLIEHKEQVVTREQILSDVWGYEFIGDTNVTDVYIRYLRRKVDKGFGNKLIETCRGVGYRITESKS